VKLFQEFFVLEPDNPREAGTQPSIKLAFPNHLKDMLESVKSMCYPFKIVVKSIADPVEIIAVKKQNKENLVVLKLLGKVDAPPSAFLAAVNPGMSLHCYCLGLKDIDPVMGQTFTFKKFIGFLTYFPIVDFWAGLLGKIYDDIQKFRMTQLNITKSFDSISSKQVNRFLKSNLDKLGDLLKVDAQVVATGSTLSSEYGPLEVPDPFNPSSQYFLASLVSHVSYKALEVLLSALLIDTKVCLYSGNQSHLTRCVSGLVALLHPFASQSRHVFPCISHDMTHLLDPPFPVLLGVNLSHDDMEAREFLASEDFLFCDLDRQGHLAGPDLPLLSLKLEPHFDKAGFLDHT
jgi:hypothetical protein